MPRAILGANSITRPKSSGISSIQTLSSFCQSVSAPSIFLASLITVANGCGCPGAVGAVGAEAGRAAGALACRAAGDVATAVSERAAGGAPAAPGPPAGVVAHPAATSTHVAGTAKRRECTEDLRMDRNHSEP